MTAAGMLLLLGMPTAGRRIHLYEVGSCRTSNWPFKLFWRPSDAGEAMGRHAHQFEDAGAHQGAMSSRQALLPRPTLRSENWIKRAAGIEVNYSQLLRSPWWRELISGANFLEQ